MGRTEGGQLRAREIVELMFEVVMGILGEDEIRVSCWQEGSRWGLEAGWLLFRHQ